MRAIRLHEFGPPENLVFEEVPDPVPDAGQVVIAVAAAGVHLLDTGLRRGEASGPFPPPELPSIPGREVAGVVERLGDGVDASWLGRRVVCHLGPASQGYAEKVATDTERLHGIADGVTPEVAVAMIGTGRTALLILEAAAITADDVVVVPAAAGGLGALLVQAALDAGAFVVGLAGGAEKTATVRGLGAHVALDYTDGVGGGGGEPGTGWPDAARAALDGREVTVVLDGVGGVNGERAMRLLAPGGRLVMFGYSEGTPTPVTSADIWSLGITVTTAVGAKVFRRPGGLRDIETRSLAAAAAGTLVPLTTTFPLKDAAAAHAALETRATTGKVVLVT